MRSLTSNLISIVIGAIYVFEVARHNLGTGALLVALPYLASSLAPVIMLTASLFSKPIRTDERWSMFFVALVASNLFAILYFAGVSLVNPDRNLPLAVAAQLVTLALVPFYIYAVLTLGRQLTVMPEARKLITHGAYAVSRHPLYVTYIIWFILQIAFAQTLIILVLATITIVLLVLRAQGEEALLARTFPAEWAEYRQRVGWIWRWSPGFASHEVERGDLRR